MPRNCRAFNWGNSDVTQKTAREIFTCSNQILQHLQLDSLCSRQCWFGRAKN